MHGLPEDDPGRAGRRVTDRVMNTLSAFMHLGEVWHPLRRFELAADLVAAALEVDLQDQPAKISSLEHGARVVGTASAGLLNAVRSNDIGRCAEAAVGLSVAGLRVAAELPDPYRVNMDQSYRCARENTWAELMRATQLHKRQWASVHEGFGVVFEEVVEFGEDAARGWVEHARVEVIQVAAMGVRFLADLVDVNQMVAASAA